MMIERRPLPHIVLIILDAARHDGFGCYGHAPGLTPNCDALAREGMVLRNHYAPGCGSTQSHASIFLGQHPARHRMATNLSVLPSDVLPMPQRLRKLGYRTFGHCRTSFVPPAGYEHAFGFDELIYPGKKIQAAGGSPRPSILDRMRASPTIRNPLSRFAERVLSDKWRLRASAQQLDGQASIACLAEKMRTDGQHGPVFAYTTLMHPHTPYYPPRWCRHHVLQGRSAPALAYRLQTDIHGWENGDYGEAQEALEGLRLLYQAELFYADHLVGTLVQQLKALQLLDQTLLIVTSDHGELLGEHGRITHAGAVWEELLRTPCLLRYPPAIAPGTTFEALSSGLDIVPTVFDLLGESPWRHHSVAQDGVSWFSSEAYDPDRFVVIDAPPAAFPERLKRYPQVLATAGIIRRAIRQRQAKYIWQSDGRRYLSAADKPEHPEHNRIAKEPELATQLHDTMVQFYQRLDPAFELDVYPVHMAADKIADPSTRIELSRLGYYQEPV